MGKHLLAVSAILVLASGAALAGSTPEGRDLNASEPRLVDIVVPPALPSPPCTWVPSPTAPVVGIAQPESDASAVGWDNTPAAGNWGGRGADGSFAVAWENDSPDLPDLFGRFAEVTIPGQRKLVPMAIEIGFLAGIANDDFCVLVQKFTSSGACAARHYVAVGCYNEDETNQDENWTTALFILPPNVFAAGEDVTVQIRVTGNAWWGFGTWGQLGVDYVKVWGRKK